MDFLGTATSFLQALLLKSTSGLGFLLPLCCEIYTRAEASVGIRSRKMLQYKSGSSSEVHVGFFFSNS